MKRTAFTLLELILVVAVVAILSVLVFPDSGAGLYEQLQSTAEIVSSDLAYGRSLAVAANDKYQFTWDTVNNQYILRYSGTNSALTTMPDSPFRLPTDPPTQHIMALGDLPHIGPPVQLLTVAAGGTTRVTTLEFGPLGGTTSSSPTTVWLSVGGSSHVLYVTVQVNPVTGLATIGPLSTTGPAQQLLH